jgi:hypothetical protein
VNKEKAAAEPKNLIPKTAYQMVISNDYIHGIIRMLDDPNKSYDNDQHKS